MPNRRLFLSIEKIHEYLNGPRDRICNCILQKDTQRLSGICYSAQEKITPPPPSRDKHTPPLLIQLQTSVNLGCCAIRRK